MADWDWLLFLGAGMVLGGLIVLCLKANAPAVGGLAPVHNSEVWKYTDWQGQERSIEVHRVVE